MATGAAGLSALYGLYHPDGRPLADEEAPIVRAARGERFSNVRVDWDPPLGRRTVLVAGGTITTPGAPDVGIVTFEDITAVEAARRRADALAEAGAVLGGAPRPGAVGGVVGPPAGAPP